MRDVSGDEQVSMQLCHCTTILPPLLSSHHTCLCTPPSSAVQDGFDEAICPLDYDAPAPAGGVIIDDDLAGMIMLPSQPTWCFRLMRLSLAGEVAQTSAVRRAGLLPQVSPLCLRLHDE